MKRRYVAPVFLTITLFAENASGGEITVRLYDFADAPAHEVARAQQEAASIFARSGIGIDWLVCTLDETGTPADPACHKARGPAVLNLRLAPTEMGPRKGLPGGIFGFSLMSTSRDFSSTAIIYLGRVSAIADGRKYRRGVVLGAMIAHELGHLLLGVGSHSKMGLMTLPWGPEVLTAADQGTLGFTASETRQLREAVNERVRAACSAQRSYGRAERKQYSAAAR